MTLLPQASPRLWSGLFMLAACTLLLDMLQGAALSLGLSVPPVAQALKAALLLAMLALLRVTDFKVVLVLLALALCMMTGPLLTHWMLEPGLSLMAEVSLIAKLLAPLVALLAFYRFSQSAPEQAERVLQALMLLFATVLVLNLLLGFAGFGYAAYSPMEDIELAALGSSGFFVSANELSALLLVLTAYLLHRSWPDNRFGFLLVVLLALFCAAQLLTKTALLGVVLLTVLIPWLHLTASMRRRSALVLVLFALVLLLSSPFWLEPLLVALGLHQKLLWVWQERGLLGLLLSSRELYLQQNLQLLTEQYAPWHWLLGVGQAGIALYQKKYFVESDLVDLAIFFGLPALVFAVGWFGWLLRLCWHQRHLATGRVLLLLNGLLLLLAVLVGHVLTSGILWLPWGAWCGWLLAQASGSNPAYSFDTSLQATLKTGQRTDL
ncbi:O-antigen ligase family protein [Alkalimonas delamerensis]|uniref:O-antigen ligase family protein n=1 Tax=Alkalimonas delamerensis TaxID=265981 RepID=A0ABT9GPD4_9GAMM|nr:O-antigen ligase family protein [Alkalimonas delamerensis]MDP4528824.1 O-antigen ligase family protein [Alkalimonas delamerensis]